MPGSGIPGYEIERRRIFRHKVAREILSSAAADCRLPWCRSRAVRIASASASSSGFPEGLFGREGWLESDTK
jgi:hypothetical protein